MSSTANTGATAVIEALGIDVILAWLETGASEREIARTIGCSGTILRAWLRAHSQSARVRDARCIGAEAWEEQAIAVLKAARVDAAANPLIASSIVALAREEAQACWRKAAVRDPDRYEASRNRGTAVQVNVGLNGQPLPARRTSTAELERIVAEGAPTITTSSSERSLTPLAARVFDVQDATPLPPCA